MAEEIWAKVPLPKRASAKPAGKHCVGVQWKAGRRKGKTEIVDLSPMINAFKLYKPLRSDSAAFPGIEAR